MPPQSIALTPAPAQVSASRFSVRRVLAVVASVALSVVCLYVAMRGTDLRAIGSTLAAAHLGFIAPLLAAQVLFYTLKAFRWKLLLEPACVVRARRLAAPMMIGFMGNNLLPARLGELIRMHLGARLLRISHSQVLATLILERLFDFIAVLALFAVGVATLPDVPRSLVSAAYISAMVSGIAIAGTFAFVAWTSQTLKLVGRATRILPASLGAGIVRQLELGASGMAALRRPRLLAAIVTTSVLQWFLMAFCIFLSFRAVEIPAPLAAAFIVLAATVFGVMVPAAPGFFGTLHLAFVLALTPFHVAENKAMAAAVFYHIIPYVCVILAGAYFVRQMGVGLRDIERDALHAESVS